MDEYPRPRLPDALLPAHRKPFSGAQPPFAVAQPPRVQITQYQPEVLPRQSSHGYHRRPLPNQSSQFGHSQQPASVSSLSDGRIISSLSSNPASSHSPPHNSHPNRPFSFQTSSINGFSSTRPTTTSSISPPPHPIHRSGTNNSTHSSAPSDPRRSTSSRSSDFREPMSYVASMRKLKATVWCGRLPDPDPRDAALDAAKRRARLALRESDAGRTSTITGAGKVRSTKGGAYIPANLSGVSVPVRLSANEIPGDDEEGAQDGRMASGDGVSATARIHNRSSSGRSSVQSGKYPSGYPRSSHGAVLRFSAEGTPPPANEGGGGGSGSPGGVNINGSDRGNHQPQEDYFANSTSDGNNGGTPGSAGGGGDSDAEEEFGEAGELRGPLPLSAVTMAAEQANRAEELRRRGSVDERSMTMGGRGRLFVANPDPDPDDEGS